MDVFKLTNQNHMTRYNTQWGPNVTHEASGRCQALCTDSWLHFYLDPHLAIILNPFYGHIKSPRLYEAKAEGKILIGSRFSGIGGASHLTTIREIDPPTITLAQRRGFAASLALQMEQKLGNPRHVQFLEAVVAGEIPDPCYAVGASPLRATDHIRCGVYLELYGKKPYGKDDRPSLEHVVHKNRLKLHSRPWTHIFHYAVAIHALKYGRHLATDLVKFAQNFFGTK